MPHAKSSREIVQGWHGMGWQRDGRGNFVGDCGTKSMWFKDDGVFYLEGTLLIMCTNF
jgi:hypothetical protein